MCCRKAADRVPEGSVQRNAVFGRKVVRQGPEGPVRGNADESRNDTMTRGSKGTLKRTVVVRG